MKIKIKCLRENNLQSGRFPILIYNSNKELIYKGMTNSFGELNLELPRGIYKIQALSRYENITKIILVNCNFPFIILFLFNNFQTTQKITFNMLDENYKNLPIKKGVIILWPNNT